jgi:tetratricopeptide (TPR) repeat protein
MSASTALRTGRNDPCPCGSGRKYKSCCGLLAASPDAAPSPSAIRELVSLLQAGQSAQLESRTRQLIAQHPDAGALWQLLAASLRMQGKDALAALQTTASLLPADAAAHNNFGNALAGLGRLDEAVACYLRARQLDPGVAEVHNNLGNVLLDLGRLEEALDSYRRALEINPDYGEAHGNLGNAARGLGRLDEAVASYRRAVALSVDASEALNNLGLALRDLGRLDEAVASYRQALTIRPDYAEAHSNLGIALRLQARTAEAEASCRRALALNPRMAATLVVLAESHADQGRFGEAEDSFGQAISIEPDMPEAWAGMGRLRKMTAADAPWLAQVQRILAKGVPARQEVLLRYALGKYFDDLQEFDRAFADYKRANELTRRYRVGHDRRQMTGGVDLAIQHFDQAWFHERCAGASASTRPVFIVGMLRSGTTLAEQILASHPDVFGAGELPYWSAVAEDASPGTLAKDYLRLLAALAPAALRVVDKMPANFLRLGLIHAALPNARILHMRRNPIDTCLSIYFQHFESSHSYANDLQDLAHAYREYLRLMQHWRRVLPGQVLLDVPYEGLVENQEAWSRRMLEFIDLPWDPRCLAFERTDRTVITASKWQVRQKINSSSLERWRNYQQFIGPLRELSDLL